MVERTSLRCGVGYGPVEIEALKLLTTGALAHRTRDRRGGLSDQTFHRPGRYALERPDIHCKKGHQASQAIS